MADIWGRTISVDSVLSGDTIRLIFGDNFGMIVSSLQIQADRRQAVNKITDLQTGYEHLITRPPPMVQCTLQGLVTTPATYKAFLTSYASLCSLDTQNLIIEVLPPSCEAVFTGTTSTTVDPTTVVKYTLSGAYIVTAVGQVTQENYSYISSVALNALGLDIS